MNITIVQGGALPVPPLRGGAIEKVWFSLGKEFARRGHRVVHISRTYSGLPKEQWLDGVHHIRVKGFEFSNHRHIVIWHDFWYVLRVLRNLPQADILVVNTPLLPFLVRNRRLGAVYKHVARYPKGQMKYYRGAARLQAVSKAVAEAIVSQDPASAAKVCVLPNPLPMTVGDLDVAELWSARRKEILYVGRLHPEKGIHELIGAFKLMVEHGVRDWRLIIVGPWTAAHGGGGEQYYETLRASSAPVVNKLEFVGPVYDPVALSKYYRRARLFVYPSLAEHGEALPLAPLEAMAEGCPPMVSKLACFRDFIEDGRSGFIFDHRSGSTTDALYESLNRVIHSEKTLMSVAVRSYAVARTYDLSVVAGRYLDDFDHVIKAQQAAK